VLGAPGSGCTTFLKVIATERNTYANVADDADMRVFPIRRCSSATMARLYTTKKVRETAPCDTIQPLISLTDDTRILTVRQTLYPSRNIISRWRLGSQQNPVGLRQRLANR